MSAFLHVDVQKRATKSDTVTSGHCLVSTSPQVSLPSRQVPLAHPAAGGDLRRDGPRPLLVLPPKRLRRGRAGLRRRRCLYHGGLADSAGSPGPAPSRGPPGGPNEGLVGAARKAEEETRSKCEAQAKANSSLNFLLPLRAPRVAVRVWARTLCSVWVSVRRLVGH